MSLGLRASTYSLHVLGLRFGVSDWPKNEIKVETFRIDNPIRTPKVEKLRLQPLHRTAKGSALDVGYANSQLDARIQKGSAR